MDKKDNENRLISSVMLEMQKTQALAQSDDIKDRLMDVVAEKHGKDITLRQELLKDGLEASETLNERIEERAEIIEDLFAGIHTDETAVSASLNSVKRAISELRKVNPKKANELENSLALKDKPKKTRSSIRRKP